MWRRFVATLLLVPACFATIDEKTIPCDGCDAGDVGAPTEASMSEAGDDATATDVPRIPQPLTCGAGVICTAPKSACCASNFADPDPRHGICDAPNDCSTGDYFTCESELHCVEGRVCCVVRDQGAFTRTECASSCGDTVLCAMGGAACGAKTCAPSSEFPTLYQCY